MHLPDTLGPGLVTGLDVAMLVKGKTGFYSIAQCNTSMLDSFRQLESMNQTYSTAIGTHGSARHFDLTFVDSQAMVAVDVCIAGAWQRC